MVAYVIEIMRLLARRMRLSPSLRPLAEISVERGQFSAKNEDLNEKK